MLYHCFMRLYLLFFLLCSSLVFAEIIPENTVSYYAVDMSANKNPLYALNASSPIRENGRVFHAYTNWNVTWKIWWFDEGNLCRLTKTQVDFKSNILLPEFPLSFPLAEKTRLYLVALRRHEEGHVLYGRAASEEIEHSFSLMPAAPTCQQLLVVANQMGERILSIYQQKEKDYDIQTKHGITQGALLTP